MNFALDSIRAETSGYACAALMRGLAVALGQLWPLLEESHRRVSCEAAALGQSAGHLLPVSINGSVSMNRNDPSHVLRVSKGSRLSCVAFVLHFCRETAASKLHRRCEGVAKPPPSQLRNAAKCNIMEHIFRTLTGRASLLTGLETLRPESVNRPWPAPFDRRASCRRSWHTSPTVAAGSQGPVPCPPEARSKSVHR